jgi:hypothetical protein
MMKLGDLVGFSDEELEQLTYDIAECNRALADPGFKALILSCAFVNTDDTSQQVWDKVSTDVVMSRETLTNLGWWATHESHTIAEEGGGGVVTCNRPLYDTEESPARSNTQLHERCHMPDCGYSHRSPTDYFSVPYQMGNRLESWLRANPIPPTQ